MADLLILIILIIGLINKNISYESTYNQNGNINGYSLFYKQKENKQKFIYSSTNRFTNKIFDILRFIKF